jgi:hypothetical protein
MVAVYSSESRHGPVGIVIRLRAGRSGIRIPVLSRICFLLQIVQTDCGAHPALYSMGTGQPECEVNRSRPSGSKLKE